MHFEHGTDLRQNYQSEMFYFDVSQIFLFQQLFESKPFLPVLFSGGKKKIVLFLKYWVCENSTVTNSYIIKCLSTAVTHQESSGKPGM